MVLVRSQSSGAQDWIFTNYTMPTPVHNLDEIGIDHPSGRWRAHPRTVSIERAPIAQTAELLVVGDVAWPLKSARRTISAEPHFQGVNAAANKQVGADLAKETVAYGDRSNTIALPQSA
jgi:ABC-type Fe3+-hydroxamate transport system substrate-binding protein